MYSSIVQHNEVCLVCDKWIVNQTDKLAHWQECPMCVQAYHKSCIPLKHRFSRRQLTCTECFEGTRNADGVEYKCCPPKDPELLLDTKERPFKTEYYQIDKDGKKTEGVLKHQRLPHKKFVSLFFFLFFYNIYGMHAFTDIIARNIIMLCIGRMFFLVVVAHLCAMP